MKRKSRIKFDGRVLVIDSEVEKELEKFLESNRVAIEAFGNMDKWSEANKRRAESARNLCLRLRTYA